MTSGSDIPKGHTDRPPEVEYSERLIAAKWQDEGGAERLCSPTMELERAVIQLQKDFDDCRTEFENHEKADSSGRPPASEAGEVHVDTGSTIPVLPPPQVDPKPADQDLLIQRLMGTICPPQAGGTGPFGSDGIGNHATELAPGRNSHRGKSCVAKSINSFRRGVFFVRSFDPCNGRL